MTSGASYRSGLTATIRWSRPRPGPRAGARRRGIDRPRERGLGRGDLVHPGEGVGADRGGLEHRAEHGGSDGQRHEHQAADRQQRPRAETAQHRQQQVRPAQAPLIGAPPPGAPRPGRRRRSRPARPAASEQRTASASTTAAPPQGQDQADGTARSVATGRHERGGVDHGQDRRRPSAAARWRRRSSATSACLDGGGAPACSRCPIPTSRSAARSWRASSRRRRASRAAAVPAAPGPRPHQRRPACAARPPRPAEDGPTYAAAVVGSAAPASRVPPGRSAGVSDAGQHPRVHRRDRGARPGQCDAEVADQAGALHQGERGPGPARAAGRESPPSPGASGPSSGTPGDPPPAPVGRPRPRPGR